MQKHSKPHQRVFSLDFTRSLAIVLMVIFHFIYDLKYFGLIATDIPDGSGWQQFRWLIISLFFICLGAGLHLSYRHKFSIKKFGIRLLQITTGAGVISLGSYFLIPQNWIFFGVLHFIALSSLMALPFIRAPLVSLVGALLLLFVGVMQWVPTRWPFYPLFDNLPAYTNDYVAIVPWFGMVLLGIYLASLSIFKADPCRAFFSPKTQAVLAWPGQHSLSIYLLHQPLLISLLWVIL